MRDLSMHVLDIAQNSIKAGATLVTVRFDVNEQEVLTFSVRDNGCGMSPEFLARVTDPLQPRAPRVRLAWEFPC